MTSGCWCDSQLGGFFGEALRQRRQALVAAAHNRVQAGTLGGATQHRGAAVLLVSWRKNGSVQSENRKLPWRQASLTIIAGEILDGDVLNGNLLQEIWILAAGVARDDALPPQPVAQPGQVAVTVEGVGQEVAAEKKTALARRTSACQSLVRPPACAHSVDRECSVSNAPGLTEVIWLS